LLLSCLVTFLAHAGGEAGAPDLSALKRLIDHPLDEVNRLYRESLSAPADKTPLKANRKDRFGVKKHFAKMLQGHWDKVGCTL
jgi:hypothetical protein